jgi:hypothetical protein
MTVIDDGVAIMSVVQFLENALIEKKYAATKHMRKCP